MMDLLHRMTWETKRSRSVSGGTTTSWIILPLHHHHQQIYTRYKSNLPGRWRHLPHPILLPNLTRTATTSVISTSMDVQSIYGSADPVVGPTTTEMNSLSPSSLFQSDFARGSWKQQFSRNQMRPTSTSQAVSARDEISACSQRHHIRTRPFRRRVCHLRRLLRFLHLTNLPVHPHILIHPCRPRLPRSVPSSNPSNSC